MKGFYIIDLFKNLVHNKNFFALTYLFLNLFVVCGLFFVLFGESFAGIVIGLVIYLISALIGLSPVGEWFLRRSHKCIPIERYEDRSAGKRLSVLFSEVCSSADKNGISVREKADISLFIREDDDLNAFAVGRKTICVTSALLDLPDDEIKAILGHELGHLATHDTDLVLLISAGNFIVSAIVTVFKLFVMLFQLIVTIAIAFCGDEGAIVNVFTKVASFLSLILVNFVMFVWTKIGIWMVMKTSRDAEFEADAFSCRLGYADGLLSFFQRIYKDESVYSVKKGADIFAAFSDSHPKTVLRVQKVIEYKKRTTGQPE